MQRILQLTEDQKRAILSHRRTYIAHMTQLSKVRKQLLQQLHSETALELSNGELEARQTCEDQILRQLENCTVEANRQYFHYVGSVGHDVSWFPAADIYPFSPPRVSPPPAPPPLSHTHTHTHTLFFSPHFPLSLATPSLMPRPISDGSNGKCKPHHVCSYLAGATLVIIPACVLDDDHQA